MNYYLVEPEVAGGWGKNTVFTRIAGKPTVVHKLHYHFEGWLGDELLESTPCFIVTERLAKEIEQAKLTGITFGDVEITASEQFNELYPNRELPNFLWLKIDGVHHIHDFGMTSDLGLAVSETALQLLKKIGISNASLVKAI